MHDGSYEDQNIMRAEFDGEIKVLCQVQGSIIEINSALATLSSPWKETSEDHFMHNQAWLLSIFPWVSQEVFPANPPQGGPNGPSPGGLGDITQNNINSPSFEVLRESSSETLEASNSSTVLIIKEESNLSQVNMLGLNFRTSSGHLKEKEPSLENRIHFNPVILAAGAPLESPLGPSPLNKFSFKIPMQAKFSQNLKAETRGGLKQTKPHKQVFIISSNNTLRKTFLLLSKKKVKGNPLHEDQSCFSSGAFSIAFKRVGVVCLLYTLICLAKVKTFAAAYAIGDLMRARVYGAGLQLNLKDLSAKHLNNYNLICFPMAHNENYQALDIVTFLRR